MLTLKPEVSLQVGIPSNTLTSVFIEIFPQLIEQLKGDTIVFSFCTLRYTSGTK